MARDQWPVVYFDDVWQVDQPDEYESKNSSKEISVAREPKRDLRSRYG